MTELLTLAAQQVRHVAICAGPELEGRIAAALRAAADQVVPEEDSYEGGFSDSLEHQCRASERRLARAELLAIAAELEAAND